VPIKKESLYDYLKKIL